MQTVTAVPEHVFEVTTFPSIIFGYQMSPDDEPFIFTKHVPGMAHEEATVEKVWDLVFGHASKYSTDTFRLQSPNMGRPFFGDVPRAPWTLIDQEQYKPFVFCGLLTDVSNNVWGATMPHGCGDGWGFCQRVAMVLFGDETAQKVSNILKELHEGTR